MYNRAPYNRAAYNRKTRPSFEWAATAVAESQSAGSLMVIRFLTARVNAEAAASGHFLRVCLPTAKVDAESGSWGDYIRTLYFEGIVSAESFAEGTAVSTYGEEVLTVAGLNMQPGDELIIDTEHMTVTLNGVNIVDLVTDESVYFKLKAGANQLIVETDTSGQADIKTLWKDRWL